MSGPAQHVLFLAEGMRKGYETILAVGVPGPGEGNMDDLARTLGVGDLLRVVPSLRRKPGLGDLKAFWDLWRLCRRLKPDIVHTHTSKAGSLGRLAARLAGVPVILHTFHGHVFHGYFGRGGSRLVLAAERILARFSTRLYAISPSQREDLLALGIATPDRIRVLPLGLDLAPLAGPLPRGTLRRELGLPEDAVLIGCVARLVPVKAHAGLLAAFARVAPGRPEAHLVLVGDGELRPQVEAGIRDLGLSGRVHLTGWRRDLGAVYGDLDLAVLSSLNEGTPVALIEAAAAGVPVVATRVGGVGDVLAADPAARLVPPGDAEALARALDESLDDLARLKAAARTAAADYRARYDRRRLASDLGREYGELLGTPSP